MEFLRVVGAIVVIAAIAGSLAYLWYLIEKRRTEGLRQIAQELNFDFEPKGRKSLLYSLKSFNLCSQGHSHAITNLLLGTTGDLEVAIFDYQYVIGRKKHKQTWNHSVVCFRFTGTTLPVFSLRPEDMGHKIGQWFGMQDFDFESHPRFSRRYLLRGSDEAAVRGIFTKPVLDHLQDKSGICVEGGGNTLLYYRRHRRLPVAKIRGFMEEGFGVLGLFHKMG